VSRHLHVVALAAVVGLASACAGSSRSAPPAAGAHGARIARAHGSEVVVRAATAMIGTPYRYGGTTPRGFDCSGLVVYSFAKAGVRGLPRSAEGLERHARKVSMDELRPGDLLFFRLDGKKTGHVAIYVGDGAFVHAPSKGKRVEKVSFGDVYWGPRLRRAGRIEF
jgi:cell wall-associated NlpC family hydrolase